MEIVVTDHSDETKQSHPYPHNRTNLIPCSPATTAGSPILSIFNRHFHLMSGSDGTMMASPILRGRHMNSQGAFLASSAFASVTSPLKVLLRAAGIDAITVKVLCCACETPDQLRVLIRKQPVEFATLVPPVADRIKIVKLLATVAEGMSPESPNPAPNQCLYQCHRYGSTKSPHLQCDATKCILPFCYTEDSQFHYLSSSSTTEREGGGEDAAMAGPSICSITIPPTLLSITLAVPLTNNDHSTSAEASLQAQPRHSVLAPVTVEGDGAQNRTGNTMNEPFSLRIGEETIAPQNDEGNAPSDPPVPTATSANAEDFAADASPVSANDLMSDEPVGLVLSSRALKQVGRRGVREVSVIHIDGNGNAIVGGGVIEYADGTKIFDLHPRLTKFLLVLGIFSTILFASAAAFAIAALVLPYYRGNRIRWSALHWSRGPSFMDPGSTTAQSYGSLPFCEETKSVLIGVFSLLLFGAVFSIACAACFFYFRRYNKIFLFLPTIPIISMIPIAYMLFIHVMGIRGVCGNRYAIIESDDYEVLRGTWMVVSYITAYILAYCLRLAIEYAPVVCLVRFPIARLITPTPPLVASPHTFSPIRQTASGPIPQGSQRNSSNQSSDNELAARNPENERRAPIVRLETDDSASSSSSERFVELSPAITPRYAFHEPTNRPQPLDPFGSSPPRFAPPPLRFRVSPSSPPRTSGRTSRRNRSDPPITNHSPF